MSIYPNACGSLRDAIRDRFACRTSMRAVRAGVLGADPVRCMESFLIREHIAAVRELEAQ